MNQTYRFEVFFDGDCPLCLREINFLRRRDRKGHIQFSDITDPEFDAASFGLTMDDFMAQIRGRLPCGTFVSGVEVFRQLYGNVGFGWVVPLSRLPVMSSLLDHGYQWFAKNRLRITGRCTDDVCSTVKSSSEHQEAA